MKMRFSIGLILMALVFSACAPSEKQVAAQRERDPQYQYEKAVVCMNAGLTDEALKYLSLSLSLDPNHVMALNLRGLAFLMKGNVAEAAASLENCVRLSPNFSDAHNNLATALQGQGQIDRAEIEFRKAFDLDGNANAGFNLAKIYFQGGKYVAALDYVQRSIRKFPRSLLALNLQGLILEALDKPEPAIASYEGALRIVPEESNVEFNLAVAYYKMKDVDKARSILEKIQRRLKDAKSGARPAQEAELKKRVDELLIRMAK
jgi:tetratricopeptide (TPR) repeat protein